MTKSNSCTNSIPILRVSDVKKILDFADECRAAVIARGETPWVLPKDLTFPAYAVK